LSSQVQLPWALLRQFVARAIRARFEGTLTGFGWVFLQPLAMLAVYSLMFVTVLRARLPPGIDVDFVPFLAVALWPWTAFAESLIQGNTALQDNAGLLAKVAMPKAILVISRVIAAFALHAIGFGLVLLALPLLGYVIDLRGVPLAFLAMSLLGVAASGLALALSTAQVFVRDTAQVLGPVVTIGFFLTPIFYPREMLPISLQPLLDINPVTAFVEVIRWGLFDIGEPTWAWTALAWFPALSVAIGVWIFRRLSRHVEDFL